MDAQRRVFTLPFCYVCHVCYHSLNYVFYGPIFSFDPKVRAKLSSLRKPPLWRSQAIMRESWVENYDNATSFAEKAQCGLIGETVNFLIRRFCLHYQTARSRKTKREIAETIINAISAWSGRFLLFVDSHRSKLHLETLSTRNP